MTDTSQGSRPVSQEFEKVLTSAATTQASFDEESLPFAKRVQRFLHSYPTVVPFVVLVLGLVLGMSVNYSRFVTGSNLSTVLIQVTIVGFLGIAQTLVILTAGIDLSVGVIMVISSVVMGRLAVLDGVPIFLAFPLGLMCGLAFGWLNGALVTRLKMPPFIVTLGTLSIIGALNTFYSQSETIRSQDIEASAPFLQLMGIPIEIGGARIILGSFLLICCCDRRLVRPQSHRLWPPSLRDRRRSGGRPPRRHQHRPHPAERLRACRTYFSDRRLGADRPRRRDKPHGGRERQSRQHHRCRDRGNEPVRRARLDRRHLDRRADRRRLPLLCIARRA